MTTDVIHLRDDIARLVREQPDAPAVIDAATGREFSYGACARLMDRIELYLSRATEPRPRRVATLLPNSVEMFLIFLACLRAGLGFAPLAPESSAREVRRWVELVRPDLVLVAETTADDVLAALDELDVPYSVLPLDGYFGWLPVSNANPAPLLAATGARLYLTTSGTTGEPKALVFDADRLWSAGCAFVGVDGFLDRGARFLNILPMSYLGGLFNLGLIPLAAGGSVVVTDAFSGKSFLDFWQKVERFDVNVLWLVPTIVRGLLRLAARTQRHQHAPLTGMRACFVGTAPIDLATKAHFEALFRVPLLENFALSETTFFASETLENRIWRRSRTVGELLPYADVRFEALDDGEAVEDRPLQLMVKTPFLFLGYLTSDGRLDLPLDADGYLPTGDLGHLDGRGRLVIDGRSREIIKKGGLPVSLRELEVLVGQHPLVAEAAAVSEAHEVYGEAPTLFLKLAVASVGEGDPVAEVTAWLRANLARHKWPERVEAIDDFPRTSSGEIRKQALLAGARDAA